MLFSTSVSMVSSGLIYCRLFPYKANVPESTRWEMRFFSTMVDVCGTLDLILVVMGSGM